MIRDTACKANGICQYGNSLEDDAKSEIKSTVMIDMMITRDYDAA